MINLLSVRLHNFRLINDATFSPMEHGITGLSGANGVGKSSFLEGALWALYGEVPKDVSQASLRRQGSSTKDECFVQVEFIHEGQKIIVTRSLQGKQGTAVLHTWLDGAEQTGPSVNVGQTWIKKRLGIDAKGFTTAFVIKQKELDALVKAPAPERRATIERLSGVDRMSAALKAAREDASAAKKRIEGMPGSEDDVILAAETVEMQEFVVNSAMTEFTQAERDAEDAKTAFMEAREKAIEANQQYTLYKETESKVQVAENALTLAQAMLVEAQERLERAASAATANDSQETIESAQEAYNVAQEEARVWKSAKADAEHKKTAKERDLSFQNQNLGKSQDELAQFERRLADLKQVVPPNPTHLTALQDRLLDEDSRIQVLNTHIGEQQSLISSLQESLEGLTSSSGNTCPTCRTTLDNPQALIESLQKSLLSAQNSYAGYQTELREVVDKKSSIHNEIRAEEDLHRKYAQIQDRISQGQDLINGKIEEIRVYETNIEGGIKTLKELTRDFETFFEVEEQLLNKAIENAYEDLLAAKKHDELLKEVETSQKLVADRERSVSTASENVDFESMNLNELHKVTEQEVDSANETTENLRSIAQGLHNQKTEKNGEVRVQEERLKSAQSALERAQREFAAKKDAVADIERKAAVAEVLDEFRKTQIARIAPELSETATGLIASMTNGDYVEVNLDENFTPSVVNANGDSRPASWLSGGEISIVALALRIAIGDLLTNGIGGLLWLDEVLVSQDAERRASVIETLRNLNGRQIIMINHTQEAQDVVDKTVRLVLTEDGTMVDDS
jgi:DNA repair protein SbcC/Rad50